MSITLTYPIRETHENLALKKIKQLLAYYRIPNTPITITDEEKRQTQNHSCSNDEEASEKQISLKYLWSLKIIS